MRLIEQYRVLISISHIFKKLQYVASSSRHVYIRATVKTNMY